MVDSDHYQYCVLPFCLSMGLYQNSGGHRSLSSPNGHHCLPLPGRLAPEGPLLKQGRFSNFSNSSEQGPVSVSFSGLPSQCGKVYSKTCRIYRLHWSHSRLFFFQSIIIQGQIYHDVLSCLNNSAEPTNHCKDLPTTSALYGNSGLP